MIRSIIAHATETFCDHFLPNVTIAEFNNINDPVVPYTCFQVSLGYNEADTNNIEAVITIANEEYSVNVIRGIVSYSETIEYTYCDM